MLLALAATVDAPPCYDVVTRWDAHITLCNWHRIHAWTFKSSEIVAKANGIREIAVLRARYGLGEWPNLEITRRAGCASVGVGILSQARKLPEITVSHDIQSCGIMSSFK
jgi:hypothetical protein